MDSEGGLVLFSLLSTLRWNIFGDYLLFQLGTQRAESGKKIGELG